MTPSVSETEHAWWAEDITSVASTLSADPQAGLDDIEAAARLVEYGPNELDAAPTTPLWRVFVAQFANTMIVVLMIAAGITVAIGEVQDAVVIVAIVILNSIVGFVQEYRAEQAITALRDLTAPDARVVRAGARKTIAAGELVPGDVMVLEAGDIVAADARLVEAPNLRVDESALTGESVPVDKTTEVLDEAGAVMIGERTNMVLNGTAVVYGRGRAVVVAIGMSTALGRIAGLLKAHESLRTPLQRRLSILGRLLAVAAVVVSAIVFFAGIARGEEASLMFLTAVSLAVAAIPEALPAVVTIGLALGARQMVAQNALIRRLPAVETLGSVTVICTDKTGTLTEGRMLVEKIWTAAGEYEVTGSGFEPSGEILAGGVVIAPAEDVTLSRLLTAAALCNDADVVPPADPEGAWTVVGDPTEGALLALAAKSGFEPERLRSEYPRVGEVPFDSTRKRMSTVHRQQDHPGEMVATKGAVEAVVVAASTLAGGEGDGPLDGPAAANVVRIAEEYAGDGFRVLAIAGKHIADMGQVAPSRLEEDLTVYGLVAMADPPRSESSAAIAAAHEAGIRPIMITGDHPATARAIADRIGMLGDTRVMTGAELAREGPDHLAEHVTDVGVYARTSPEQKLDIVQAWRSRGDIVAMTGDGVNDAPALKSADIGVTMGITGTDVAKEASDMVLTDDNFATIVAAVGQGRRIYDNIRRFIRYTLTSNTGEIWVMLLGPFVGLPLPLLPAQILWINLVTDGLPGLALSIEGPEKGLMTRPPRDPAESMFSRGLWQHVLIVGLVMGFIPLALGVWAEATGRPWQTMVFTSLALLQLGHALAVRSETESLWSLGLTSNMPLLFAVLGTVVLQMAVVFWSPVQSLLDTEALNMFEIGVVLVASTGVLWAVEIEKVWRRRRIDR